MSIPVPPPRPVIVPGRCMAHDKPPCGQPARLYPHGWLCDRAAQQIAENRRATP